MSPNVDDYIYATARDRRKLAIQVMSTELDPTLSKSSASKLKRIIEGDFRPVVISGDIDGVTSAALLGSVTQNCKVIAVVNNKDREVYVHPDFASTRPNNLLGLDVFSPEFDNVSNHIVLFGDKRLSVPAVLQAFNEWDAKVIKAANDPDRLMAVPGIAGHTQAGYSDPEKVDSSKYKYPLGTAQWLLALLEVMGKSPKFYERQYLPWLIANCDGGVTSYRDYGYNVEIWWSTMAAAVGSMSHSETIYSMIRNMRPLDYVNTVHQLQREFQFAGEPVFDDKLNLRNCSLNGIQSAFNWIFDVSGWSDPVQGGITGMDEWVTLSVDPKNHGIVSLKPSEISDPEGDAARIGTASSALNANFYIGGETGSRFNWMGGWE
jgi:hypothetical protein